LHSNKIWYISKYALNPKYGGPQRQYLFSKYFTIKGYKTILISSNSNGFHYIDFKGKYKLENDDNFKHYILKGNEIDLGFSINRIISWFLFEYRLIRFLKKQKIDKGDTVIVSSLSILTFLSGKYLKKKYGVNLIVEVRDIWPQTLIEFKNISKKNLVIKYLAWVEKLGYKYADVIVGTMGNLKAHVKKISPGCEQKVRYIPMGFDQNVYGTYKEEKKADDTSFVVGYAGTIGKANKIDLILEAAKILVDQSHVEIVLLGDGVLKEKYVEECNQLSNIKFFPKVDKSEVFKFLSSCDILLNPWEDHSIYQYGVSPNKWIDYMYAAKPIIVPFNGYKNIINEAGCGEFIETNNPQLLADKILKYYKMPKIERERIGLNGKEYLEKNLTYDILSDKYLELIKG
jgi:glycosyltransferase involved in cell wall biosynthesis